MSEELYLTLSLFLLSIPRTARIYRYFTRRLALLLTRARAPLLTLSPSPVYREQSPLCLPPSFSQYTQMSQACDMRDAHGTATGHTAPVLYVHYATMLRGLTAKSTLQYA